MNKRAVIIFDFDGTVADTAPIVLKIANEILEKHADRKFTEDDFERLRSSTPKEVISELGIPLQIIPKLVSTIRQKLKENIDEIDPYNGMPELIGELANDRTLTLAILSSNTPENIEYFLAKFDLRDPFRLIQSNVGVFNKKSKLKQLARRAAPDGEPVIYIGDEARDVDAALKSGVECVAVTWGLNSRELLVKSGAKHVADDVDELKEILKALLQ